MPDDEFPDVPAAFAALVQTLKAEAVRGDFDRTAAFLRHIQTLESRWVAGEPPHTMRTPGKAKQPAAPAPEPAPPSSRPSPPLPAPPMDVTAMTGG